MIAFATQPILGFQFAPDLVALGGQWYTAPLMSGDVLSVQPNGTYQTRPAGTAGAYERARKVGGNLVYGPYTVEQMIGGQMVTNHNVLYVVPILEGLE